MVYADDYNPNDTGNDFLGIKGLSTKDVVQGSALGLIGYGVYQSSKGEIAGPAGSNGGISHQSTGKPIYDVAAGRPEDFSEIKRLIDLGNLQAPLRSEGPFTFFAPTNLGLGKLTPDEATALTNPANREKLIQILKFHIVVGRYTIADLKKMADGTALNTLGGETVVITNAGGLKINGVPVTEDDIPASNGWIHPIQSALTPTGV